MPGERPFVHAFSTVTLDARLASRTGFSKLSCPHDLVRLHRLRAKYDAVMVGANTILVDNPSLRLKYVRGKNPKRVVVDGALRTHPTHRVYDDTAPTILITSTKAAERKSGLIEEYKNRGVRVLKIEPVEDTRIPMKRALQLLLQEGISSLLVEGGGRLLWSLLREKLIDRLSITYVGTVYGAGPVLFDGEGHEGPEAPLFRPVKVLLCPCGREVHVELVPYYDTSYLRG